MDYGKMFCIVRNAVTGAATDIDAGEYERFIFALS